MKNQINFRILSAIVLTFLSLHSAAQCKLDKSKYTPVWTEEFLNLSNWDINNNNSHWNMPLTLFDANHVTLVQDPFQPGDNWLRIKAEKLSTPEYWPTNSTDPNDLKYYRTGHIISKIDLDNDIHGSEYDGLRYGMIEIRCSIPSGHTWGTDVVPCFWTFSGNGEIDVFDDIVPRPSRQLSTGMINWTMMPDRTTDPWTALPCSNFTTPPPAFDGGIAYPPGSFVTYNNNCYTNGNNSVSPSSFGLKHNNLYENLGEMHVYTAVWTPTQITFFLDGREVYTKAFTGSLNVSDYKMRLEIAIWAFWDYSWGQDAVMDVDYVRVYKPTQWLIDQQTPEEEHPDEGVNWYYNNAPYKSRAEYINHNIFTNDVTMNIHNSSVNVSKVNREYKAIAAWSTPNDIFFRGEDNEMYHSYYSGGQWNTNIMTGQYSTTPQHHFIAGDILSYPGGNIFYRGADARLQYRGYDANNNYWFFAHIDNNWNTTNNMIKGVEGSIDYARDGIFFIGQNDNKVHRWQDNNGSHIWSTLPVGYNNGDLVSGDLHSRINTSGYHEIFYRGFDGQLHTIWEDNNGWHQGVCGTSPENQVMPAGGSIALDTWDVYFRGTDNKLHRHYNVGMGWQTDMGLLNYSYPVAELVAGEIAYDATNAKLIYFGGDWKLQSFERINSNWVNKHIDDYWNTFQYEHKKQARIWSSSSLLISNSKYLYAGTAEYEDYNFHPVDERNHLRYFIHEPCEVLDPILGSISNLNRQSSQQSHVISTINSNNEISVYPNPSNGIYQIEEGGTESCKVEVYDLQGKLILEKQFSNSTPVDISEYANGTYLFKIITGDNVIVKKVQLTK